MNPIFQNLRQKGYRLTNQRQQILNVLTTSPHSVEEIIIDLKNKKMQVDKVTVYRTLECFMSLGIVEKIQFKDKIAKYELRDKGSHHHHLVCETCGSIEDITLKEDVLLKEVSKQSAFTVKSHSLEFFGQCAKCK